MVLKILPIHLNEIVLKISRVYSFNGKVIPYPDYNKMAFKTVRVEENSC